MCEVYRALFFVQHTCNFMINKALFCFDSPMQNTICHLISENLTTMVHFLNLYFVSVSSVYVPKALLCSCNINAVLQIDFKLQGYVGREAIHFFVHFFCITFQYISFFKVSQKWH